MKLLIRRSQKSSLMGKAVFVLEVRADISAEEKNNINKYKLADTLLYERSDTRVKGSGVLGFTASVAANLVLAAMNISITAADLANGRKIECKDIIEMLAVEEQIKEAAATFKQVLDAAAQFGGEEIIEL
jgi:F420-0:gamma-glutamyl ligase-like protein